MYHRVLSLTSLPAKFQGARLGGAPWIEGGKKPMMFGDPKIYGGIHGFDHMKCRGDPKMFRDPKIFGWIL